MQNEITGCLDTLSDYNKFEELMTTKVFFKVAHVSACPKLV